MALGDRIKPSSALAFVIGEISNRLLCSAILGSEVINRAIESLFGATLDLLDGFLRGSPALQNQAVGNVVLVDVADVGHRFLADLLGRNILHVLEPDVGVESALGGFLAQLRNRGPRRRCRKRTRTAPCPASSWAPCRSTGRSSSACT